MAFIYKIHMYCKYTCLHLISVMLLYLKIYDIYHVIDIYKKMENDMGRKRRKRRKRTDNSINNIDKSVNEINYKINIRILLTKLFHLSGLIATVFTITGVSLWGGKALLDNKDKNIEHEAIKEEKYYRGTITKTGWESKFIGLRYTNPDGMIMLTEEELDESTKFKVGTASIVFNQKVLGQIRLTTVNEMGSMSNDKSIIARVCAERLIDDTNIYQAIEEFEFQIDQHPLYNYQLLSDNETVKIGNADYIMVSYMINFNNVYRYIDIYFRIVGDRLIMISFNFNNERERDKVLNSFTAY